MMANAEELDIKPLGSRKEELLEMLYETIKNSENLPPHVRSSYVTYMELEGVLALMYSILKELQD